MRKNLKLRVSLSSFIIVVLIMSNCAFADNTTNQKSTVTKSQNGVKVTKSAKWYKENKDTDQNLIQVDIDVDTTDADVSDMVGTTTDMVFVLDVSSSMNEKNKFANLKSSSIKLFREFINAKC